ncbi:MAG: recombination protein O N-terminal domain-containing protein [Bacteroidota bacterium]
MLQKTKGIVLGYIKYGDTSIITRIYTEQFGYASFIVNSIRSQKTKKSIGYFNPFTLLDMVVYLKQSRDIQRVSEFKSYHPLHRLHFEPVRSAVTMFLTEVFIKLIQEDHSQNKPLFHFLEHSVKSLDQLDDGLAFFHLQFLLKLASYLGYEIQEIDTLYRSMDKLTPYFKNSHLLEAMISDQYGSSYDINLADRNSLLSAILDFYGHHAQITRPKSLNILRSLLE